MLEKFSIKFLKNDRNVYVYTPKEINEYPDSRYNVLYMFDGHNIFEDSDATYGKSWGMKDYLDFFDIPLIVVGLESNRDPGNGRLEEYSPFSFSDYSFGSVRGHGQKTMDFIINQLKPIIDENFPTMPEREHTFIGGSSMGGLMALYAVSKYNNVFSRAAALSPSLWTKPYQIKDMLAKSKFAEDTIIYMDYGAKEFDNHPKMRNHFAQVQSILYRHQILLTTRIVPHGEHSEANWEKQVPFFIETLLYDLW